MGADDGAGRAPASGAGTAFRAGATGLIVTAALATVATAHAGAPAAPAPGPPPGALPELVVREVLLMGTTLEGRAWAAERPEAAAALEAAFGAVRAEEELLSSWREESHLSRLNRSATGEACTVPPRLHALLSEAWDLSAATGGSFDPVVGPLVEAWDLRGDGRRPSEAGLGSALAASGRDCFELGEGRRVTKRCDGAWIDAGAFGKGSALRRARAALEDAGVEAALLDFGGQLLAFGSPPGRAAWPAAVAHPADRARPLVRLALRDRSAATTASSERFVVIDGEARGHVLDPRTGRPVEPWGSATVVTRDPMRADALSTGLFVMGPEGAMRWAVDREAVGVLVLEAEEDGGVSACWNEAMERYLEERPERRVCPGGSGSRAANDVDRTEGRN